MPQDKSAPAGARRIRPNMPNYGVLPEQFDGMLGWDWVEGQMAQARNYWIATTSADGSPHCVPVWGAWLDGAFFFGCDRQSVKAANIRRDCRAVMHLDSGDDCVIFHGRLVESQPSAAMLKRLNAAYVAKYRLDPQLDESGAQLYRLAPRKVLAWQERDYPASVTCWRFDA